MWRRFGSADASNQPFRSFEPVPEPSDALRRIAAEIDERIRIALNATPSALSGSLKQALPDFWGRPAIAPGERLDSRCAELPPASRDISEGSAPRLTRP